MRLSQTKPDPSTAINSATFQRAAVKRVIDEDTGERVGWMRLCFGEIEWSAFDYQGFSATEAEALAEIEAAVLQHRANEAADAAYVAEVMALPEPARTARRNRDKAVVMVEVERHRIVINAYDLANAERALADAEADLDAAMAIGNRRAA
ncbi:hypothetical protein [Rhizobiales bacterium 3FA27D7]|jgi:hypothetical protein|uniref:hypothetical protein n=1 Tax=Mesorhizobium sp. 2RAF21 TaxID=3232995 RepID=UPI0010F99F96